MRGRRFTAGGGLVLGGITATAMLLSPVPAARADPPAIDVSNPRPTDEAPIGRAPYVRPRPGLVSSLTRILRDPGLAANDVTAAVSVLDEGPLLRHRSDDGLLPASNEKILTAVGALELLPPHHVFRTTVLHHPRSDDLALVAGGDPTLTTADLERLAGAVAASGLSTVTGDLVVDVRHFPPERSAPGWLHWHVPRWTGPLTTLIVDRNRGRGDDAFLRNPEMVNAGIFARALEEAGVTVMGRIRIDRAPQGATPVALHTSRPVPELVVEMLRSSNNEIAESLIREIGFRAGGNGSTRAGTEAVMEFVRQLDADFRGTMADGSGMSRRNSTSARDLVAVLDAVRHEPWFPTFAAGLPVAGETGTLARRLTDPATRGLVRAKTGTIRGGIALAGYVEMADGGQAAFAIIVNGESANGTVGKVDEFVRALANGG